MTHNTGFVYVLTNPSLPDVVKIGMTSLLAEDRAQALFTTGLPTPFDVGGRIRTSRPAEVEREAHTRLAHKRESSRREFFRCNPETAIETVEDAARDVAGVSSWSQTEPHIVRKGDHLSISLSDGDLAVFLTMPTLWDPRWTILDIWQSHSRRDRLDLHGMPSLSLVSGATDASPHASSDATPWADRDSTVAELTPVGKEYLTAGDRVILAGWSRDGTPVTTCFEADRAVQVVGRTSRPATSPDGWPVTMHDMLIDPSPHLTKVVRPWIDSDPPRAWAPRVPGSGMIAPTIGTEMPQPPEWLPQLARPRRRQ